MIRQKTLKTIRKFGGFTLSPTIELLGIHRLPREQRFASLLGTRDTIAAESGQPLLTDAQRRELKRRIAQDDTNPDDVVPGSR